MDLAPTTPEKLAQARNDLRIGLPIILSSDGQASFILSAETLKPERFAALQKFGRATLAITSRRASAFDIQGKENDPVRIVVPKSAKTDWVFNIAGAKGSLDQKYNEPLQVEAGDASNLHRAALALTKSEELLPAVLMVPISAGHDDPTSTMGLTRLTAEQVIGASLTAFEHTVSASVPFDLVGSSQLHVFRSSDGTKEHYAIEIGTPDRNMPVLARLHSACFTGDLLGSLRCDCGPQLRAALKAMAQNDAGVLLYLNQEGRGIGLTNKLRAYLLQDMGFDTVEANHRLGFDDDERDFRIGAAILRSLGFSSCRLMTNNPAKVERFESCGIKVDERVPLMVGRAAPNRNYLAIKAKKLGHIL